MVKYMGVRDLVPRAMTHGSLGNRLPLSCLNFLSYKMDIMIEVPDL